MVKPCSSHVRGAVDSLFPLCAFRRVRACASSPTETGNPFHALFGTSTVTAQYVVYGLNGVVISYVAASSFTPGNINLLDSNQTVIANLFLNTATTSDPTWEITVKNPSHPACNPIFLILLTAQRAFATTGRDTCNNYFFSLSYVLIALACCVFVYASYYVFSSAIHRCVRRCMRKLCPCVKLKPEEEEKEEAKEEGDVEEAGKSEEKGGEQKEGQGVEMVAVHEKEMAGQGGHGGDHKAQAVVPHAVPVASHAVPVASAAHAVPVASHGGAAASSLPSSHTTAKVAPAPAPAPAHATASAPTTAHPPASAGHAPAHAPAGHAAAPAHHDTGEHKPGPATHTRVDPHQAVLPAPIPAAQLSTPNPFSSP